MLRPLSLRTRRPTPTVLWALLVILLIAAGVVVAVGAREDRGPLAGPVTTDAQIPGAVPPGSGAPAPAPAPAPSPVRPPSAVPPSNPPPEPAVVVAAPDGPDANRFGPLTLDIPAIGVAEDSLVTLGLNADGTVEVPADFQQAGWFGPGPAPGEIGAAVILGHVDSRTGPAVFFRLRNLVAGDRVDVGLVDGRVARFSVTSVETYPKDRFPARRVYTSNGSSDLQLVTCGGEFDRAIGSYLSNVVVYTSLVDVLPA